MKRLVICLFIVLMLSGCKNNSKNKTIFTKPYIPNGFSTLENNKVEEGFTISDQNENEFVWIPVDGKKIILSRGYIKDNEFISVEKRQNINRIYYGEEVKESVLYDDEILNIERFKKSVKENGGFYVSRYEIGDKQSQNPRTNEVDGEPVSQKGYYPYTFTNRDNALDIAKNMYLENDSIISSLINSYAWDTMINYLYNYHYTSLQENNNSKKLLKTGESNDIISNIYDLKGNVSEWTTEYSSNGYYGYSSPCVYRAESFNSNTSNAQTRYYNSNVANEFIGFRIILYK